MLDIFIAGARGLGLSDLEYRQVVLLKSARAQREELAAQKTRVTWYDRWSCAATFTALPRRDRPIVGLNP